MPTITIQTSMKLKVSEKMLQRLDEEELTLNEFILTNCFRNNTRIIDSEAINTSMKIEDRVEAYCEAIQWLMGTSWVVDHEWESCDGCEDNGYHASWNIVENTQCLYNINRLEAEQDKSFPTKKEKAVLLNFIIDAKRDSSFADWEKKEQDELTNIISTLEVSI